MTRILLRLSLLVFVLVAARPAPARAWNPLEAAAAKVKKIGQAIGGALGSPFGGFVEAATAPTIRSTEASGRRLIRDVDAALGKRVDQVGSVTGRLIAETSREVGEKLDRIDRSLEARILQVQLGADALLERAIGRIDDVARARIAQIGREAAKLIAKVDAAALALLEKADAILVRRTEDVRELVGSAIEQADAVAAARIAQLDELAGRRLGNLDVIATKQSLSIEAMLLRIAALAGLVLFIAFVLWRLVVEVGAAWRRALEEDSARKVRAVLLWSSPRFFAQVGAASAGAALLYFLAGALPRDAQERAREHRRQHETAMSEAMAAYDFSGVRYHAAQLEVIAPSTTTRVRAITRKAELLRTLFTRPAALQTVAGVREIMTEIAGVERALGVVDPDVLVIKAFVLWQVGATRADEHEAAVLCAEALEARPTDLPGGFLLASLARNYLRAFLHDPYEEATADLARLRAALTRSDAIVDDGGPFQHVLAYNAIVEKLDRESTAAYLAMLEAHAEYVAVRGATRKGQPEPAGAQAARERRREKAEAVIAAWREFDRALETSPWLAEDPTALAAFTLDDAVLSHALYFAAVPDAKDLPPAFLDDGAKLPELLRVQTAPIRIAWARRYAALVGPSVQDVLAFEEAQRFEAFEARARRFERAYVTFQVAVRGGALPAGKDLGALAEDAIRATAEMQLYRETPGGRRREAAVLLEQFRAAGGGDLAPALGAEVADRYGERRLRFL